MKSIHDVLRRKLKKLGYYYHLHVAESPTLLQFNFFSNLVKYGHFMLICLSC